MVVQPPIIDRLIDQLERLVDHTRSVRGGRTSIGAGDDLATVLQLLVGHGEGYGLLADGLESLGLEEPPVIGWGADIPTVLPQVGEGPSGHPVHIGVRCPPASDTEVAHLTRSPSA